MQKSLFCILSIGMLLTCFQAMSRAQTIRFQAHHGINVPQPFERTTPRSDPNHPSLLGVDFYSGWYTGADLRALGYDFVRMPVNPAVLLAGSEAERAAHLNRIDRGMQTYLSAGLRVIFDLHMWTTSGPWTTETVLFGGSHRLSSYRSLVRDVAALLARQPDGMVALELMNEPRRESCDTIGWLPNQQILLNEVREIAPTLAVIVSPCGGQYFDLVSWTPSNQLIRDQNVIFTFHFYDPGMFTEQGGDKTLRYIEGILYPASKSNINMVIELTNRNIDRAHLPLTQSIAEKASAMKYILKYFQVAPDRALIERDLEHVVKWAKMSGIPVSRIIMGEFAAINWRRADTDPYRESRVRWDEDSQTVADELGLASAYWYLPYPKGPIFR